MPSITSANKDFIRAVVPYRLEVAVFIDNVLKLHGLCLPGGKNCLEWNSYDWRWNNREAVRSERYLHIRRLITGANLTWTKEPWIKHDGPYINVGFPRATSSLVAALHISELDDIAIARTIDSIQAEREIFEKAFQAHREEAEKEYEDEAASRLRAEAGAELQCVGKRLREEDDTETHHQTTRN